MSEQTINDHVLPSGLTYGQEKRRASIMAQLRGYTALEPDATEDSLKAEYLALMGEPYLSAEEEASALVHKQLNERKVRESVEREADSQVIVDAKANGFMDTKMIRDGLGWDKPRPDGSFYNPIETADRYVRDAGEDLLELITHWQKAVPRWEYLGVYPDVFARVLAHKNAVDAKRAHDEWKTAHDSAVENRKLYGDSGNMNWTTYIESLGPEPAAPDPAVLAAVEKRHTAKDTAKVVAAVTEQERILQAMRDYTGPMNKAGTYPKGEFMGLRGAAKRELWDRRNE